MPVLPFAEWLPDQPAGAGSSAIRNVIARTAKTYGPMPSPMPITAPLPDRAMGALTLEDPTREVFSFAATQNAIYRLFRSASGEWIDMSKSGGYVTLSFDDGGAWDSASFGSLVIFTNYLDPVQSYLIGGGGATFEDLSVAAPKAKYCASIRDFLFLGYTNDPIDGEQTRRVWWSSIGDPHDWPVPGSDLAIMRQSDFQDLEASELGHLTGLVGGQLSGADGGIFFQRGIVRVAYVGSPAIWDFAVSEGSNGTDAPWSIVSRRLPTPSGTRATAFFYGEDGFSAWDGSGTVGFGAQKFDRFVYDDILVARRNQIVGVAVPYAKLILWAYHGKDATSDLYNRLLVYSWQLDRATLCELEPFEWLQSTTASSLTLDDLDPFGPLDTLSPSFDSMAWVRSRSSVGIFDATHRYAEFTGPPLPATVETVETGSSGRRTKLHGTARPMVEGPGGNDSTIAVGHRERQSQDIVYSADVPINILGNCGLRTTGRYVRLRLKLPSRCDFSHLTGIEVEPRPEGRLR